MAGLKKLFADVGKLLYWGVGISDPGTIPRKVDLWKIAANGGWKVWNLSASNLNHKGKEAVRLQTSEGDGLAFAHAGGYVIEKVLQPGEILKVDTGCVVAYTAGVDFDIEFIRGIKNWMFGGEGLFFAIMRGPGKVWLQSLPISRLAGRIMQYGTYNRKEEGSILGGLGNLLDGRE